jgi:hypothetical protein
VDGGGASQSFASPNDPSPDVHLPGPSSPTAPHPGAWGLRCQFSPCKPCQSANHGTLRLESSPAAVPGRKELTLLTKLYPYGVSIRRMAPSQKKATGPPACVFISSLSAPSP